MEFCDLITTPKLDNVILHSQLREPIDGTLVLTFSHLILSSRKTDNDFELWVSQSVHYTVLTNHVSHYQ